MTGYGYRVFHDFEHHLLNATIDVRKDLNFSRKFYSVYDTADILSLFLEEEFNPFAAGGEV